MANVNFAKFVQMRGKNANPTIHRKRRDGSFPWLERPKFTWEVLVTVGDFVGEGDLQQDLDLDALYPRFPFIDNVWLEPGAHIVPTIAWAGGGITEVTLSLGDTGDPDGLVTASSVFTGVTLGLPIATPGAAQYALRAETGFLPSLRIDTTNGDVADLTAGAGYLRIPFTPFRET